MKRKEFINKCSNCGAVSLPALFDLEKVYAQENNSPKDDAEGEPMNKGQKRQLLRFIDSSINDTDKEKIFNKPGIEYLHSRDYDKWVISF